MRSRDEVNVVDDGLTALARSTLALAAIAPRGAGDLFLRLARRLERLVDADPALVAWADLWGMWREGGGGVDSFRIPGVLEAIGWGMEPDPRLRPPAHPTVALFGGAGVIGARRMGEPCEG